MLQHALAESRGRKLVIIRLIQSLWKDHITLTFMVDSQTYSEKVNQLVFKHAIAEDETFQKNDVKLIGNTSFFYWNTQLGQLLSER